MFPCSAANSSGVQLFTRPSESFIFFAQPNEHIFQYAPGGGVITFCAGQAGHGDLELFAEGSAQFGGPNTELQDRLRGFRRMAGTHEFRVGEVMMR